MARTHVTLLDYGVANLLNVARAFEQCDAEVTITESAKVASEANRLVVPGVGAFQHAMEEVRRRGHDEAILEFVQTGKPFMGICVGMQMLFDASEEFGQTAGLGILPGLVIPVPRLTTSGDNQRIPHIGWNHLVPPVDRNWENTLLRQFSNAKPAVYFVHSFVASPADPKHRLADCEYGGHRICAAVQRDNLVATQFHPERSGELGLTLLREFLTW